MSRPIPLYPYSRAAAWRRFGIVVWWLLFLIAAGWTALGWWALTTIEPGNWKGVANLVILWVPGVLPFILWTIVRWIVGGFWTLRP